MRTSKASTSSHHHWARIRALTLLVAIAGVTASGGCHADVVSGVCGDGKVNGTESCDEGKLNGTAGHCKADCTGKPAKVSVSGDVLAFLTEVEGKRVAGATVSILEHPEMQVVTGDDAHFRFDGLEVGSDVTLVVQHPDFKTTQTNTLTLGPGGIDPFPVQVVSTSLFDALTQLVPLPVEETTYCEIATTVARMGGSLYVHLRQGVPGVQVGLAPSVPDESGPIYFSESAIPSVTQPATSTDGGVLFYRVPPGQYVMTASMPGMRFNEVRFDCRPGIVVNAGPPMGLLANVASPNYAAGQSLANDDDTAASDALCDATAACVDAEAGLSYPPSTVLSCKAMFRNAWAFVDPKCDADGALRASAKAVYACRTASCALALGGDEACAAQETEFRSRESAYGACISAQP